MYLTLAFLIKLMNHIIWKTNFPFRKLKIELPEKKFMDKFSFLKGKAHSYEDGSGNENKLKR